MAELAPMQRILTNGATTPAWGVSFLWAEVWWCGDDHCDCTQAQINRIEPNRNAGPPWINRETVWEGPFHTDSWEEPGSAMRELEARLAELEAVGAEIVRG